MDTPLQRPGSTTPEEPPTSWLRNWTGRVSKARERTTHLRTVGEADALDDRSIAAVHELQLTYEELSVAEEELRSQNQQLAEALTVIDAERERYRQLFKEAPVAYFITDETGMIRDANLAASHLTRCSIEFLAGKPLVVFTRHDSRRKLREMLLRLHQGNASAVGSFELTARKDSVVHVDATAHAMSTAANGGREIRWLFVDDRPRRRRERMAHERSATLEGLVAERTA